MNKIEEMNRKWLVWALLATFDTDKCDGPGPTLPIGVNGHKIAYFQKRPAAKVRSVASSFYFVVGQIYFLSMGTKLIVVVAIASATVYNVAD